MRQIFLDTETTGLDVGRGHRIIEIACVEMINRKLTGKHFHHYVNPGREVEEGAFEIHGISNEFLLDKPEFSRIAEEFFAFVRGADLIIHNAPFDMGFINHELSLLNRDDLQSLETHCRVIDTLAMAREKHPGQKNNLDALCRRYEVDNSQRELHGALLDAEILADVYLCMTGGQVGLALSDTGSDADSTTSAAASRGLAAVRRLPEGRQPLPVIAADEAELAAHHKKLEIIQKVSGEKCLWLAEPPSA